MSPATGEHRSTRIPLRVERTNQRPRPTTADAQDFLAYAAGAANVIMQLSWPEVGYGVLESPVESGNLLGHPVKRARTTFTYLAVAVAGRPEDRRAYGRAVSSVHAQVRSTDQSPVGYRALDRSLQMWVAACLYVGFEDTHQLLHGRMDEAQRSAFLASAAPLATTLQVRAEDWPPTPAAFDEYWQTACRRVSMDEPVRRYLNDLVDLRHQPELLRRAASRRLRFLTTGFLPPLFRDAMGWEWSADDQRRFERTLRRSARVNAMLPRRIRHAPSAALLADLRRRTRNGRPLV